MMVCSGCGHEPHQQKHCREGVMSGGEPDQCACPPTPTWVDDIEEDDPKPPPILELAEADE